MFELLKNQTFRTIFSGVFALLQGAATILAVLYVHRSPYLSLVREAIVAVEYEFAIAKVITALGLALVTYRFLGLFFFAERRLHHFSALPMAFAILLSGAILLPLKRYGAFFGFSLTPQNITEIRLFGVEHFLNLALAHGALVTLEGIVILVSFAVRGEVSPKPSGKKKPPAQPRQKTAPSRTEPKKLTKPKATSTKKKSKKSVAVER